MNSTGRIKKIEEKLGLLGKIGLIEYMGVLYVHKNLSFEEGQTAEDINETCRNKYIGAIRGKRYLGQFRYGDLPNVAAKVKEIYKQAQENIRDNPNAAAAMVWLFLIEKENGEVIVKKNYA